ncbi:MAG TPA: hypothetical protein VHY48_06375 [Acidobacteriaceae bacterium]|nr:hypothetical protein [Acidobacteriaceae bacterium]
MTNSTRFTVPMLAVALCAVPAFGLHAGQQGPPPPPPPGQNYESGAWDAPPPEYHDPMTQRAFHDGVSAARNDMDAHRRLDYHRSPLFKHPPVPGPSHDEYRNAFERGYDVALRHAGVPGYAR